MVFKLTQKFRDFFLTSAAFRPVKFKLIGKIRKKKQIFLSRSSYIASLFLCKTPDISLHSGAFRCEILLLFLPVLKLLLLRILWHLTQLFLFLISA